MTDVGVLFTVPHGKRVVGGKHWVWGSEFKIFRVGLHALEYAGDRRKSRGEDQARPMGPLRWGGGELVWVRTLDHPYKKKETWNVPGF